MTGQSNFFVAGPPVSGQSFFGRKRLIDRIASWAQHGGSCGLVIVGTRRIGKSSILKHVSETILSEDESFVIVTLDGLTLQKANTAAVAGWLAWGLLKAIEAKPFALKEPLEPVVQGLSRIIDEEVGSPLLRLMDYFEEVCETGLQPILLIDEIDGMLLRLPEGDSDTVAGSLRHLAVSSSSLICTSCHEPWEVPFNIQMLTSAWYNVLIEERLGLFTDAEALKMLGVLSHSSGNEFTVNECHFLMRVFGNFPYYLQYAGYTSFSRAVFRTVRSNARRQAFIDVVPIVARQLQSWYLRQIVGTLDPEESSLLKRIAHNGRVPKKDKTTFWRLKNKNLVTGTPRKNPRVFSLLLQEILCSVPEESFIEKAGKSLWESFRAIGMDTLRTATLKAVEAAAGKYL